MQPDQLTEQRIQWIPKKNQQAAYWSLPAERQRVSLVTARAGRQGTATILAPETASFTKLWADSQLLIMFSWNSGLLTSTKTVAAWDQLSRGDIQHTWDGALVAHLGNWAARTGAMIKVHSSPGIVCSPSTWLPELIIPGKGTKRTPNPCRPIQNCVWVSPVEIWVSSGLLEGFWLQQIYGWNKYGISPLGGGCY